MKLEFSRQVFEKYSNIKLLENPLIGRRVVPYVQTEGRTDMKDLIDACRNFGNASKHAMFLCVSY
jgi:hypothetical protein